MESGVKEGGVLIFVIEGREGLCGNAPLFHSTVRHIVTTICISKGFSKTDMECLGFNDAKDINEALKMAFDIMGEG